MFFNLRNQRYSWILIEAVFLGLKLLPNICDAKLARDFCTLGDQDFFLFTKSFFYLFWKLLWNFFCKKWNMKIHTQKPFKNDKLKVLFQNLPVCFRKWMMWEMMVWQCWPRMIDQLGNIIWRITKYLAPYTAFNSERAEMRELFYKKPICKRMTRDIGYSG